jgi:3',5'-cyclic AMP phosphodiesterase CpdA
MFRLAHISDPHLTAIPQLGMGDWMSKRLFGFYNWHRNRRRQFGPATLTALVEDIHAAKPDHIAVTGDLVNLGLAAEFTLAAAWLKSLGGPNEATLIPGNHDVYMPGSFEELAREWGAYMRGDDAKEEAIAFPFVRRRGRVAIVGVSSAIPTGARFATGMIGAPQAARLAEALAALGTEEFFRVVLVHHSPVEGATGWRRRLVDASRFREAILKGGAELVLHGHNHFTHVAAIDGPHGSVPVVGVAAASVLPGEGVTGGSYCLFEIETENGFSCRMSERALVRADQAVETIREQTLI